MIGDGYIPKLHGTEFKLKNLDDTSVEDSIIDGKSRLDKLLGNPGPR